MAPYAEGYRGGVILTNQRIVGKKIYTLSLLLIRSFLIKMSAFLWVFNRLNMNYGASESLSKKENNFRVYMFRDWPSATAQLRLGNLYNSELGIYLGDKLWTGTIDKIVH